MAQKIYPKRFPSFEVDTSWQDGTLHIARLTNGTYAHITGLPINNVEELRGCGMPPAELERALNWWEHRHDLVEANARRIIFEPDGTPLFEDGTPVSTPSELIGSLEPGPVLDAALIMLARKLDKEEQLSRMKASVGPTVKEVAGPIPETERIAAQRQTLGETKRRLPRPKVGKKGGKLSRPTPAPAPFEQAAV
jgi:hypothetical protein